MAGMGHDGSQIARRCERAVVNAYRDLRQIGTDDLSAFGACTTLYRIHHPESSLWNRAGGWPDARCGPDRHYNCG